MTIAQSGDLHWLTTAWIFTRPGSPSESNDEEIPLLVAGWSESGGSLVVAFMLVNLQDLHILYLHTMNFTSGVGFIILLSNMFSKEMLEFNWESVLQQLIFFSFFFLVYPMEDPTHITILHVI